MANFSINTVARYVSRAAHESNVSVSVFKEESDRISFTLCSGEDPDERSAFARFRDHLNEIVMKNKEHGFALDPYLIIGVFSDDNKAEQAASKERADRNFDFVTVKELTLDKHVEGGVNG